MGPGVGQTNLSLCLCFLSIFFGGLGGDREAPLGQHGSPRVAAGDVGRRSDMGKTCKSQPSLPWPFGSLHVAG